MSPAQPTRKSHKSARSSKEVSTSRPRRRRVSRSKTQKNRASVADKTVILAMSPNAANTLRVLIGRCRVGEEVGEQLQAIANEISDQLNELEGGNS